MRTRFQRVGWTAAVPALCLGLLALVVYQTRRGAGPDPRPPLPEPVRLLCDIELGGPMAEILERFERRSGLRVEAIYGECGRLTDRLEADGGVEVFLPGDPGQVREAARRGLVADSVPVAARRLVIQAAPENPFGIESAATLGRPGLRLAWAETDERGLGWAAREATRVSGASLEAVERNVAVRAGSSAELSRLVAAGAADAAFVWLPDARRDPRAAVVELPSGPGRTAFVEVAIRPGAGPGARELVRFLRGSAAREIFARHSFDPVPE